MKYNLVVKLQREELNATHQLMVKCANYKNTTNMKKPKTQLKA